MSRGLLGTSAAYIVVEHDHAYIGWDSNAVGHPSGGIAQVIGPTFQAYALPGHHDIWNPVDNLIAAFRYAISRCGSMNNIPGVVAVRQGGSYVGYLPGVLPSGAGGLPPWEAHQRHERARNVLSARRKTGAVVGHAFAGAASRTR